MSEFKSTTLSTLAPFITRGHSPSYADEPSIVLAVGQKCIRDGKVHLGEARYHRVTYPVPETKYLKPNDVLINSTGTGTIGRVGLWDSHDVSAFADSHITILRSSSQLADGRFLAYLLASEAAQRVIEARCYSGSTNQVELTTSKLKSIELLAPSRPVQLRIATYLLAVDQLLRVTGDLIEKYKSIKAGMMHDLFTRGLGANGKLRPRCKEVPSLYKESQLGLIPEDWTVTRLECAIESIADGPFGSNLKTEHYSPEGGVRVVRLQNVQAGYYDDSDRALISLKHADYLEKHSIKPGDVLVAGLGDEAYPVGRACLYPNGLGPAINKADCFRIRCLSGKVLNCFLMHALNTHRLRVQIERYKQGVTRQRINTTNLKRVLVALPIIDEQNAIDERLSAAETALNVLNEGLEKLKKQKLGLMEDLLSGRKPVIEPTRHQEVAGV